MHHALADLLSRYGIAPQRWRCVARLDCEVWRITPSRPVPGAGDLALRLYAPGRSDRAPIEAEVAWLAALAAEGLHVPRPLVDRDGLSIQRWHPAASDTPRHALVLVWLPGRMHDRGLTPERLRRLGLLTARLHATAERMGQGGLLKTPRPAFTADLPLWASGGRPGMTRLPASLQSLARAAAGRLSSELAAFPTDAGSYGFVHGDLHPWNVLFQRREAGAIDFSDCGWGHHALDLASALQYLKYPLAGNHDHLPQYERLRDGLLSGYAAVRPLPPGVSRQIDTYLAARFLVSLEWMLDDWPRLDHRAWGPGFMAGVGRVFGDYLAS